MIFFLVICYYYLQSLENIKVGEVQQKEKEKQFIWILLELQEY